jgi:uncharacterized repeat protein (TIGR01451 family)
MRRKGHTGRIATRFATTTLLIALATLSSPVHAALQFYTDKATFQAAAPGLTTEDFESTGLFNPDFIVCSDPFSNFTDDDCWNPGDIALGLTIGSSSRSATVVLAPSYYGSPSIATGANAFEDATEVGFPAGTLAAGMDLIAAVQEDFTISVFGANDVLLGTTTAQGNASGLFFGVKSTLAIKRIELASDEDTLVDNVSFEAPTGSVADMSIGLSGVEGPAGTMTFTLTATNLGPNTASGVVATLAFPAGVSYVSVDCAGSNAVPPWTKNIATLANGASVVCQVVATFVDPQISVQANVVSNGSVDLNPGNDAATASGPIADLSTEISASENPGGSVTLTVTVTNQGPSNASSIVASVRDVPSLLAYVSDDCGGSNTLAPWTWNIPSLASGNNVVCHIHTNVATPGGLALVANVESNGPLDPDSSNDQAAIYTSVTGPGPDTPAAGFALFRSFFDLAFKDETGASFSLRNNAGKVILLQMCAVWCGPCNAWTALSPDLKQSVDQKIGAGHFLDVDLLVEGPQGGAPSTQANAQTWKTKYDFPGPVLHAEGSLSSPIWLMDIDRFGQYAAIQQTSFFPEFFILAPDCNNQIAVRIAPGAAILGEQRGVDTSTVEEMANVIAAVWNERPCAKPVVHRLDRCSVGSTQIYSNPQSGDFAEAAEAFNVPSGEKYVISSVTAVTDASILDFTVYADAAGSPGSAVCTSTGRPASVVYAPGVKKIDLDAACKLPSGNYWMALKGRVADDANFVPTWHGGFLPVNGSYFYRDNAGCTAWDAAGTCLAGQQDAQLCYMLETDVLFSGGFEAAP